MGEIGISRHEFLYEIKYWEAQLIVSGYRNRDRTFCIMMRRATFWNIKSSMADTKAYNDPTKLWPLPWDDETNEADDSEDFTPSMTEEEQADIQRQIDWVNQHWAQDKEKESQQ